ncbi:MAG: hypothetical protein WA148_06740 [Actinomycetota bacterium]
MVYVVEVIMDARRFLETVGMKPEELILSISAEEAISNLLEAVEEYCCSELRIEDMKKEDIETLLKSYGDAIVTYHPEGYHQERAALLKCFEMLEQYGLTEDDYEALDFC